MTTESTENPGSTSTRFAKLRSTRPAATSSTAATVTSAITSAAVACRAPRLNPARAVIVSSAEAVLPFTANTAPRPNAIAVNMLTNIAKTSTVGLMPTLSRPGTLTDCGTRATSAGTPQ